MKKSKIYLIIALIIANIMFGIINDKDKIVSVAKTISSFEIVMEKNSHRVLYSSNENVKRPMASTTKVITALTVINNSDVEDVVEIKKEDTLVEGSSIYLKEGEKLKVIDLLYGLMLRSGNDSALALARYVGGSVDNFAKLMNKTAKEVGAMSSNFTNPHGLNDKNHYTTAYDLALITCNALNNPLFAKIVSTKRYRCVNQHGDVRIFVNKNKMLSNYDGANGVKTGFTKDAGRCLVSSATKNGMTLVSVVLSCAPMYERSSEILDNCFSSYSLKKVVEGYRPLGTITLSGGLLKNDTKMEFCSHFDVVVPLKEAELDKLSVEYDVSNKILFPVKFEQMVGNLNIMLGNDLIYSQKLYIIGEKQYYDFDEAFFGVVDRWEIYENQ